MVVMIMLELSVKVFFYILYLIFLSVCFLFIYFYVLYRSSGDRVKYIGPSVRIEDDNRLAIFFMDAYIIYVEIKV